MSFKICGYKDFFIQKKSDLPLFKLRVELLDSNPALDNPFAAPEDPAMEPINDPRFPQVRVQARWSMVMQSTGTVDAPRSVCGPAMYHWRSGNAYMACGVCAADSSDAANHPGRGTAGSGGRRPAATARCATARGNAVVLGAI